MKNNTSVFIADAKAAAKKLNSAIHNANIGIISLDEMISAIADFDDTVCGTATVLELLDALAARDKRIAEQSMLLEGADAIQTEYAEVLECQDDNDSVLAAIVALKQRAESAEQALLAAGTSLQKGG